MTYPKVALYGSLTGIGGPLLDANHNPVPEWINKYAQYDYVIIDVHPTTKSFGTSIVPELRRANPNIQLYGYIGQLWWYNPPPQGSPPGAGDDDLPYQIYLALAANNGILYRTDGTPWDGTWNYWNMTSTAALNAVIDVFTRLINFGNWDGLFLDVSCLNMYNASASGIDIKRACNATSDGDFNAAWNAGHVYYCRRLRDILGTKLMMGNCGPGGELQLFNGWMSENWPNQGLRQPESQYGTKWEQTMLVNGYGIAGYLKAPYIEPSFGWLCPNAQGGKDSSYRMFRFAFGSAALRDGAFCWGGRTQTGIDWIYPEFSVTPHGNSDPSLAHKNWLGAAKGPAYEPPTDMSQPPDPDTQRGHGLWVRDFEHGMVVVNPTTGPISYYTAGPLRQIDGQNKTGWSIPPQDALFLVRQH